MFGTQRHYICPFRYRLGPCINKCTKNTVMSVLVWSPLGVSLSLNHTHIGLPKGFNFNFPTRSPSLLYGSPPGFLYCRTLCYCFVAVDICRQFPFDFWLPDTVMDQGLDLGWQSFVNWTNHSAGFVPKNKVFRLTRQSSSFYNPMPFEWMRE